MKYVLGLFLMSSATWAIDYGYLTPEDQKYYKNDTREGNNARERIDSLVKEVNKMLGEMASLRSEVQSLRKEVDELKKK